MISAVFDYEADNMTLLVSQIIEGTYSQRILRHRGTTVMNTTSEIELEPNSENALKKNVLLFAFKSPRNKIDRKTKRQ